MRTKTAWRCVAPLAFAAGCLLAAGAQAAPGDFDNNFSGDGVEAGLAAGYQGEWRDVVPLSSGRVLAIGTGYYHPELRFSVPVTGLVSAYTAAGAVDTAWGSNGHYIRSGAGGFATTYNDAVLLASGKLLLAGTYNNQQLMVTRLNGNGTPDSTFGVGGHLLLATTALLSPRIAARSDGSFVLAAPQVGTGTGKGSVHVFGFLANGNADLSFDTDGTRALDFGGAEFTEQTSVGLAVAADGKVLVGATEYGGGGDMVVYRLNLDGSNDVGFDNMLINQDGRAVYSLGNSQEELMDLAIRPDGKILIAGAHRPTVSDTFRGVLVRINADGRWDANFDADGYVVTDVAGYHGEFFRRVFALPDGDILAMGNAVSGTSYPQGNSLLQVRYNGNGTRDSAFGTGGVLVIGTPKVGGCSHAFAATVTDGGKLYLAGESTGGVWMNTACNASGNFLLTRQAMPTTDTAPPTPLSASPANNALNVQRGSNIVTTFSEALDPGSVVPAAFTLTCAGSAVAGTLTYSASPVPKVVFDPAASLANDADCTAKFLAAGVRDTDGNALPANYSWKFHTQKVLRKITAQKTGSGKVTGHLTGNATLSIDCGSKCYSWVLAGKSYVLNAAPSAGSVFTGWQGCPSPSGSVCTIADVNRDRTVTAVFAASP